MAQGQPLCDLQVDRDASPAVRIWREIKLADGLSVMIMIKLLLALEILGFKGPR